MRASMSCGEGGTGGLSLIGFLALLAGQQNIPAMLYIATIEKLCSVDVKCLLFTRRVALHFAEDRGQAIVVKWLVDNRDGSAIAQNTEVIAGEYAALANALRQRIHPNSQREIWLGHRKYGSAGSTAVVIAAHPSHQIDFVRIDGGAFFIQYFVFDVHCQHFADDKIARATFCTGLNNLVDAALELCRALRYAEGFYEVALQWRKAGFCKLIGAGRILAARKAHLLHDVVTHHVDNNLLCPVRILEGVLDAVVAYPAGGGEYEQRWLRPEDVEKRKWRKVGPSVSIDRRSKADRPRGDGAEQVGMKLAGLDFAGNDTH